MAEYLVSCKSVVFVNSEIATGKDLQLAASSISTASNTVGLQRLLPRSGNSVSQLYSRVKCLLPRYIVSSVSNFYSRGIIHHFRKSKFYQTVGTYCPAPSEANAACGLEVVGADPSEIDGTYTVVGSGTWAYSHYMISYLPEWSARVLYDTDTNLVHYYETDPDVWINNLDEEGAVPTITAIPC